MRCSNGACVPLNSVPAGGVCISSGACASGLVCSSGVCAAGLCGDIDGNGMINIADINRLIAHVMNQQLLTADERPRANVDGAGDITFRDILRLVDKVIDPAVVLTCS